MKKCYPLLGLAAMIFFSACQKDIQNNTQEKMNETSGNSKGGHGNDHDDDDDNNNKRDIEFYALGDGNRLDKFSTNDRYDMLSSATITGLGDGVKILAIDFRPATGQLYGLGSNSRIYVINPATGAARPIGAAPFTPALAGTLVGFDFNPTVDRIRVVTNTGQNLRLNPETGVVAAVDGSINGVANAMVTSVAYSNNVAGAATTTLYDIDNH